MKTPGPPLLPDDEDTRPNILLLAVLLQEAMLVHAALFATAPDTLPTAAAAKLVHELHTYIDERHAKVRADVEDVLRKSREERERVTRTIVGELRGERPIPEE